MQLSINVEHNAGTVAWVTEILTNIKLKISSRDGCPSVSYLQTWDLSAGEAPHWNTMIVHSGSFEKDHDYEFTCRKKEELFLIYACHVSHSEKWRMFKYLTKAANKIVVDFIDIVANEFERYLQEDSGEVEISVSISPKQDS